MVEITGGVHGVLTEREGREAEGSGEGRE